MATLRVAAANIWEPAARVNCSAVGWLVKVLRIFIGVFSCIPLLSLVGFLAMIAGFFARVLRFEEAGVAIMEAGIVLFVIATAVAVPCLIGYLVYVLRTHLPGQQQALWVVALLAGTAFTFLFAWYFVGGRREPPNSRLQRTSAGGSYTGG